MTKRKFKRHDAYGYAQLCACYPNTTGIHDVSMGNTKHELYYQIKFAIDVLAIIKDPDFDLKKCEHGLTFNAKNGLVCGYCGKRLSK